jgi:hypothetical protein
LAKFRELGDVAAEGFREREAELAEQKKPSSTEAASKPASNA